MSKIVPTRNQLERAVPLIYCEMGQLFAYWVWWTQGRPIVVTKFDAESMEYGLLQNSAVTTSLLALRKLNEFFKDRPPEDNERDDDLRAYDYPGFGHTGALIHSEDFSEIHKRIGHMTFREVDYGRASYELYDAVAKVLPRCIEFLDYLRNTFYLGQEEKGEDLERVQKGLLAMWLRWREPTRVASEPATTQRGTAVPEPRKPLHCDIGWPSAIFFGVVLWTVYLFAVDRHFSESIREGPVVMLGHSLVGLVIVPIGAILGTPIWFFEWLSKGRERVSFKPCLLCGMAAFIMLCFVGREYAGWKLEEQSRSDLASLELLDARLGYVPTSNSLVEEYRRRVPNDSRSDDELTMLFGEAHDKDKRYAGYPDFVAHYQMLKMTNASAYNTIQGRIRNKGSRTLHATSLECTIYDSGKSPIDARLVTLTNLNISPGMEARFSERLDLRTAPTGFTWSYRFADATFF